MSRTPPSITVGAHNSIVKKAQETLALPVSSIRRIDRTRQRKMSIEQSGRRSTDRRDDWEAYTSRPSSSLLFPNSLHINDMVGRIDSLIFLSSVRQYSPRGGLIQSYAVLTNGQALMMMHPE